MALRKRGFWVGVFLFLAIIFLPSPAGLTESAWLVAAIAVLMVTWWATEAVPVPLPHVPLPALALESAHVRHRPDAVVRRSDVQRGLCGRACAACACLE